MSLTMRLERWFYRGGRPNWAASLLNALSARLHAAGLAPDLLVTLEVIGRRSGRSIRVPLVMTVLDGERYLVAMLGESAGWVQNVTAAGGRATLLHGRRERVRLTPLPVELRAPVLKAYLKRAPGARAHIPVDKEAPLAEFERLAARFPVLRVLPEGT